MWASAQQLVILCICVSISPTLGAEVFPDKSKSHWFSAFYLLGQSGDFKALFVPDWKTEVHIFFLEFTTSLISNTHSEAQKGPAQNMFSSFHNDMFPLSHSSWNNPWVCLHSSTARVVFLFFYNTVLTISFSILMKSFPIYYQQKWLYNGKSKQTIGLYSVCILKWKILLAKFVLMEIWRIKTVCALLLVL